MEIKVKFEGWTEHKLCNWVETYILVAQFI